MALRNMTIPEFKSQHNVESIEIVRNPNTQKLFASVGEERFRVQGADSKHGEIDLAKPVSFLYDDDTSKENSGVENGCFVNSNNDNTVGVL